MNEAVFSMYTLKCFELGIIPIRNFDGEPVNINEALDLATQDEVRKTKRKFRKLWRKAARSKEIAAQEHWVQNVSEFEVCKSSGRLPTRAQRRSRSRTVSRYLASKITK